jgi:nucleotide-binding universal stress UspA family protein
MTMHEDGVVLAPGDLSPQGVNAAWRAALVARDLGVPLRLLHVADQRSPTPAAGGALRQLAHDIRGRLGLVVDVASEPGDALAATVRSARAAALLVIGSRRGHPLRELVLGTPAERLIRLCRVPVLVVKGPARGSYRRVLAPVELGAAGHDVIAAAARLSRAPGLEIVHALALLDERGLRDCELPHWVVRRERRRALDGARRALQEAIARATPQAAVPHVGFGDPAAVALARERALAADLVVVGKRNRGLLADFFLGSVTQKLLAHARGDVLVLPRPAGGEAGAGWRAVWAPG